MKIESIFPHPSEDDLDVVTLGPGIKCVVHKGQFEVGDCVKLVPVKTVKKGIICHGVIVKEEDYVEFETEAGKTTLIIQPTEVLDNPAPDKHHDGGLKEIFEAFPKRRGLSVAEIFDGGSDIIERLHQRRDENSFKNEMLLTQVDPDDAEEDAKNFAEDE